MGIAAITRQRGIKMLAFCNKRAVRDSQVVAVSAKMDIDTPQPAPSQGAPEMQKPTWVVQVQVNDVLILQALRARPCCLLTI